MITTAVDLSCNIWTISAPESRTQYNVEVNTFINKSFSDARSAWMGSDVHHQRTAWTCMTLSGGKTAGSMIMEIMTVVKAFV